MTHVYPTQKPISKPISINKSAKAPRIHYSDMSDEQIKNLIWSASLKATSGRVDIVQLLSYETHPISIDFLHKKLKKYAKKDAADATTIYRTIESLVEAGIVQKIDVGRDRAHYELISGRTHHHHAICNQCGLVEDIPSCQAQSLHEQAHQYLSKFSFINKHSLEFFGVCKKCIKNPKNPGKISQ